MVDDVNRATNALEPFAAVLLGLQLVLPALPASVMVTVGVTEVAEALLQLRVTVVDFKTPPKMPLVLATVGLKVPKSSDGAVTVHEPVIFRMIKSVPVLV